MRVQMRANRRGALCVLAVVIGLSGISYAHEFSEVAFKKELTGYRKVMKELLAKFGPGWAIRGMFTSDFVFTGPDGKKQKLDTVLSKENSLFLSGKSDEVENWREATGMVPEKIKPKDEFWKSSVIKYEEVEGEPQITLDRFPVSLTTQTTQDELGKEKKTKVKILFAEKQVFTRLKETERKPGLLVMKRWDVTVTKAFMDGVAIPAEAFKTSTKKENENGSDSR
ncbi:MAG: hypothetical protein QM758_10250 [Armatimonas sp.]